MFQNKAHLNQIALCLWFSSCGPVPESDEVPVETPADTSSSTTTTTTTTASSSTQTLGAGGSTSAPATVASNIKKVQLGMIPESLAIGRSSLTLDGGGNPCENTNGFFDCQPSLLKLYLAIGKNMLGSINEIVTGVSGFIGQQEIGASGDIPITDDDVMTKLTYNITSANDYAVILHSKLGAFIHLDIDATGDHPIYTLEFDGEKDPEENDGGGPEQMRVQVTYNSDTTFDIDLRMASESCDSTDVRAPQNFAIQISRSATNWQGKAMLYMPRWLYQGEPTCDLTPSARTKLFMYTDFAGNEVNTTASLYMASTGLTEMSQIGPWAIQNFCTNYSSMCNNGASMGESTVIASNYINPFCATSTTATWDSACSDTATTEYTDSSHWLLPSELDSLTVTLPNSL